MFCNLRKCFMISTTWWNLIREVAGASLYKKLVYCSTLIPVYLMINCQFGFTPITLNLRLKCLASWSSSVNQGQLGRKTIVLVRKGACLSTKERNPSVYKSTNLSTSKIGWAISKEEDVEMSCLKVSRSIEWSFLNDTVLWIVIYCKY